MGLRSELHNNLKNILGSNNVYFQPPESIKMSYPCIRYELTSIDTRFAGDTPYTNTKKYSVMVIDPNPDSLVPDRVARLPMCKASTFYAADNLNHYHFTLYY